MKIRILICLILLTSATCKKEGDDCHYNITYKNNSTEPVIFAIPVLGFGVPIPDSNAVAKCSLDGSIVNPGQTDEYRPFNSCIENRLGSNSNEKIFIYVVNPDSINTPNQYYSCDSIEYNNDIFATHELSLTDLKAINFEINYP